MKRGDLVRVRHPDGWTYTLTGRVRAGSICLVLDVDTHPRYRYFVTVLIDDGRVDRINQSCLEVIDEAG